MRIRRSVEGDENDSFSTKDLILNQMIDDWINIRDLENEQILQTKYDNRTIRINIFPSPRNEAPRYTANCAPITKTNQVAENGIVHVVERVLMPVTKSLWQIIVDRSDMAVFRTVLEKTNLYEMLNKNDKHFTVFAPTDNAFGKLDTQTMRAIKDGNGCALSKYIRCS